MQAFSRLELRRRLLCRIVLALAILLASFFIPSGLYLMEPGMAVDLTDVVLVDGCPHNPGVRFLLTTVAAKRATVGEALIKGLFPRRWVVPARSLYPGGMTEEQYLDLMKKEMGESQRVATYLALKHTGYSSPVSVRFKEMPAAGPSAGLMFMLELYTRLDAQKKGRCVHALADVDQPGERFLVAGTGAVDVYGRVLPVGGVAAKVAAAEMSKAKVFLVPFENLAEAKRAARSMKVFGVRDAAHAIHTLQHIVRQ